MCNNKVCSLANLGKAIGLPLYELNIFIGIFFLIKFFKEGIQKVLPLRPVLKGLS